MKFTIVPKEVLVRGYFILKGLFLRVEGRHMYRDFNGAFARAYGSHAIACVHLARRVGSRACTRGAWWR